MSNTAKHSFGISHITKDTLLFHLIRSTINAGTKSTIVDLRELSNSAKHPFGNLSYHKRYAIISPNAKYYKCWDEVDDSRSQRAVKHRETPL